MPVNRRLGHLKKGEEKPSANGRGIIHHLAFRAKDDDEQKEMRKKIIDMGLTPTDVIDRHGLNPGGKWLKNNQF